MTSIIVENEIDVVIPGHLELKLWEVLSEPVQRRHFNHDT